MSSPLNSNLYRGVSSEPPVVITTCANRFADQSSFESHVRDAIQHASNPQILVFTKVNPSWGEQTVDSINDTRDGYSTRKNYNSLAEVLRITLMPTELHDCVQDWWRSSQMTWWNTGDLTSHEQFQIQTRVGTTLEFRSGPYRCSRKEPDLFIRTYGSRLPSLVVEFGGVGAITAILIIEWQVQRNTRVVSGAVELFVRDRNGIPIRRQRENPQRLELTRREVFGPDLLPDPTRNGPPNAMVYLEISHLRFAATRALRRMNLTPA
ncbi:hypothetical protein BDV34DRAFT_233528 [Aspergillus parasiticus]|uniref:Uncharacterized protein n=1 Tax=Aspergillus parasiticus TaxID=5067 RepID=A0A5N6D252_ASPPA|nr:hypothetical protein BDV34DRAFT_233528 [Aspergillus parasiticus]